MKLPVNEILIGDAMERLKELPDESVNCCVTSPPYWGLRDYGVDGQIGLEDTPEIYVSRLVGVLHEVRRVLRSDGTLWLNLGDSYAGGGMGGGGKESSTLVRTHHDERPGCRGDWKRNTPTCKPKDLIGIPWRVAFALQADGWWLRSDIIWAKPNPMPESVTDRPTKSHEYVFLLSKSERYYYDAKAIQEKALYGGLTVGAYAPPGQEPHSNARTSVERGGFNGKTNTLEGREAFRSIKDYRNKRTVWTIPTQPYADAHFAIFPEALIEPCILAGCPQGGVVLDPFMGAGTTALVALKAGRQFIGIELNPEYAKIAEGRVWQEKNQARLV